MTPEECGENAVQARIAEAKKGTVVEGKRIPDTPPGDEELALIRRDAEDAQIKFLEALKAQAAEDEKNDLTKREEALAAEREAFEQQKAEAAEPGEPDPEIEPAKDDPDAGGPQI